MSDMKAAPDTLPLTAVLRVVVAENMAYYVLMHVVRVRYNPMMLHHTIEAP